MNDLELTLELACAVLTKANSVKYSMSFVCALFDHVCETYGLDKGETLADFNSAIINVNKLMGKMYTGETA